MDAVLSDIRAEIAERNPVINRNVDGVDIPLTGAERDAVISDWAQTELDNAVASLRRERDALLAASDWTQAPDAPVDAKAWAAYRQQLRDLPANTSDPRDVAWPKAPK